ncbi:MAG: LysM peptidoglycan-binding domain-containing protein [Treponema sp.]|jgi:hypothetical protein|nr:LysM peptidoglycan-binding domain-containing protein [Treponema sp.]
MKKLIGLVLLLVFLAAACQSTPPAEEPSAPVGSDSPVEGVESLEFDEALDDVYGRYADTLDLAGATQYTVVRGDRLTAIAQRQFAPHSPYFFPVIMLASPDVGVSDPDSISPGMVLTIPDLVRNLDNPATRATIKQFLLEIAGVYAQKSEQWARELEQGLRELAASL